MIKWLKKIFWGNDEIENNRPKRNSTLFVILGCVAIAVYMISNLMANKSFTLPFLSVNGAAISLPTAVILFPLVFILSDIISEVYGFRASRKIAYISFACNLGLVGFCALASILPSDGLPSSTTFENLFAMEGLNPLIFVASMLSFFVATLLNDILFEKIRGAQKAEGKTKGFFVRACISTLIGQIFDATIFLSLLHSSWGTGLIAIAGIEWLLAVIGAQVLVKVGYELILSPLLHLIVNKIRNHENNIMYIDNDRGFRLY